MKKILLAVVMLLSLSTQAQRADSKFDFRFGIGASLLGTGDMRVLMFENELNYFINNYLSTSVSVGYGRSNDGVFETASLIQGNFNIYFSPFKNIKKNDFRVGTGLSYMNVSDAYLVSVDYENGVPTHKEYDFDNENSIGANIILENTYSVTKKF